MTRKLSWLSFLSLAISFLLAAQPVNAATTPYYGKDYAQPEKVLAQYPDTDITFDTPAFTSEGDAFTSQEEMISFLHQVDRSSDRVEMKIIGQSMEGRDIPALFFSTEKNKDAKSFKKKPTVWLDAQIHGNEPAAGESALVMAQKLTGDWGDALLRDINVIIVPRLNPDGSYAFTRQLANRLDGNRDHMKFDSPEVRAIHNLYNQYMPEVVIDAHEYGLGASEFADLGEEGALKYHDVLLLSGKNLNIPESIRTLSDDRFVETAHQALDEQGFSSDAYYTTSRNGEEIQIWEGGSDPRIGRNAFGLKPAISFLVETRGIGIGRENFQRRVAAQVATHTSLMETTAAHAAEVQKVVADARNGIVKKGKHASKDDTVVVQSKPTEVSGKTLTFMDIATAQPFDVPVRYFSSSNEQATLERVRPTAYILDPGQEEAVKRLQHAGVRVETLRKPTRVEVESYTVTSKKTAENSYEGYRLHTVQTEVAAKTKTFPAGSTIIYMDQVTANVAALAMEPESVDSYVTFGFLPAEEGDVLPVHRYLQSGKLK
ncbi:M14 family metallopeptidase [Desmospora activa]|uniref:M14 family metallopeptidase n=1 Tax=Desmospora activa TaxID=500615 RepID=UPI001FE35636|nr:M14 family metallocarboxypeptidase [Desmospora activa]